MHMFNEPKLLVFCAHLVFEDEDNQKVNFRYFRGPDDNSSHVIPTLKTNLYVVTADGENISIEEDVNEMLMHNYRRGQVDIEGEHKYDYDARLIEFLRMVLDANYSEAFLCHVAYDEEAMKGLYELDDFKNSFDSYAQKFMEIHLGSKFEEDDVVQVFRDNSGEDGCDSSYKEFTWMTAIKFREFEGSL